MNDIYLREVARAVMVKAASAQVMLTEDGRPIIKPKEGILEKLRRAKNKVLRRDNVVDYLPPSVRAKYETLKGLTTL